MSLVCETKEYRVFTSVGSDDGYLDLYLQNGDYVETWSPEEADYMLSEIEAEKWVTHESD